MPKPTRARSTTRRRASAPCRISPPSCSKRLTGTKFVRVPYKGTAPAVDDLIAGNVDIFFNELASALQLHKAGRAKILAVLTKQRIAAIPDIPTIREAGVPGCESDTRHALAAPPNTPAAIVAKLNDAANKALKDWDLLDRFVKLDIGPSGGTSAAMSAFLKEETRRWGDVIRESGIQPE